MLRSLGLGLITGSSDDDLSAIGTYASAGADLSMTNNRKIMRNQVNGRGINVLGWFTTAAVFAMRISSVISLFL
jgi:Mn2+/Fe2+ NRAMP family transporter